MCGGGQFECMTKFGRASAARREESARVSHAIIYRMMMNARKAGKQQRLQNSKKQWRRERGEEDEDEDEEEVDKIDLRGRQDAFCMHSAMCDHYVCYYYYYYSFFFLPPTS